MHSPPPASWPFPGNGYGSRLSTPQNGWFQKSYGPNIWKNVDLRWSTDIPRTWPIFLTPWCWKATTRLVTLVFVTGLGERGEVPELRWSLVLFWLLELRPRHVWWWWLWWWLMSIMTYHYVLLYNYILSSIIITAVIATSTIDYAKAVEDVTTCSLNHSLDSGPSLCGVITRAWHLRRVFAGRGPSAARFATSPGWVARHGRKERW